jgi:hypothetical protein
LYLAKAAPRQRYQVHPVDAMSLDILGPHRRRAAVLGGSTAHGRRRPNRDCHEPADERSRTAHSHFPRVIYCRLLSVRGLAAGRSAFLSRSRPSYRTRAPDRRPIGSLDCPSGLDSPRLCPRRTRPPGASSDQDCCGHGHQAVCHNLLLGLLSPRRSWSKQAASGAVGGSQPEGTSPTDPSPARIVQPP